MIIKGAVRPGGFAEENHQAFASLIPACYFVVRSKKLFSANMFPVER
jgi:hypothetical protein